MKDLDFIVIGAQKCATTTLFELLRQHPSINMPLEKEVPFFTGNDCTPRAWDAFTKRHFANDGGDVWGKVTPQYMANPEVPARLAALMPKTKLIAVLRDPIERSKSHFRMGVRRNTETMSFSRAIQDRLNPLALATARASSAPTHSHGYESESDFYLVWSEYGRILSSYRRHFPKNQLLVLYLEDLKTDPHGVLNKVLDFLDLDGDFRPRGLGEVMHSGGDQTRIPHGLRVWLRQQGPIASLWRKIPDHQQGRLRFLYERWNNKKTKSPLKLSNTLAQELREHFAQDTRLLLSLDVPSPPWMNKYVNGSCT